MSRGLRLVMRAVIRKSELDTVVKIRDDFKIVYFLLDRTTGADQTGVYEPTRNDLTTRSCTTRVDSPPVQKRIHDDGNAGRCENVARSSKIRFQPDEYIRKPTEFRRKRCTARRRVPFLPVVHYGRYRSTRSSPKRTVL